MPRISFASTTAKLWRLFLHPKSTLIREYSPRGNSQKPWVIQTCLHHPYTFLREKYGLSQLLPKWSRCPGYSNYTGDNHHPPPLVPAKGSFKPLAIQACLSHSCTLALREMWLGFAGFEPAICCLKWDMCPSSWYNLLARRIKTSSATTLQDIMTLWSAMRELKNRGWKLNVCMRCST